MIAASSTSDQPQGRIESLPRPRWQQVLAEAITDPEELCRLLNLDAGLVEGALTAIRSFPLRVPRSFVAKMRRADPFDPLLLQILPIAEEAAISEGFVTDPVGDLESRTTHGVLQKYSGRALIVTTGACAVHCRYCFRRHFPYDEESALKNGWRGALEHLRSDPTISEVILSGGDPLSLSDRRLQLLTQGLEAIPHVRRLRIHTRYPIVLPERVDAGFLHWFARVRLQKVVVIHANHAREMEGESREACRALREAGALLLNQSVLLARINDDVQTLAELSESLFECGALPYYLHVLDRVQGAAHFEVPVAKALTLHAELAARLPGYLVPKLVREVAGAPAKMAVIP